MLITLLTLAIATLAAAPVVLPVVKLLKSRRGEDSQWAGESESKSESESEVRVRVRVRVRVMI